VSLAALADTQRHKASDSAELERAHHLTCWLAERIGDRRSQRRTEPRPATIAERVLRSFGVRADAHTRGVIDSTLILCADHELNASTFATRVAASTGADLYACLGAALHTLSGPKHGEASAGVETLLEQMSTDTQAMDLVRERAARGAAIAGFGHALYPQGDPRAYALLELAQQTAQRHPSIHPDYARMRELCAALQRLEYPGPNLDAGLVAVRAALGLPRGAAAAMFAIGRMAGWVAHALEQRRQGYILRPRARYVA
jgi:citrate synthase